MTPLPDPQLAQEEAEAIDRAVCRKDEPWSPELESGLDKLRSAIARETREGLTRRWKVGLSLKEDGRYRFDTDATLERAGAALVNADAVEPYDRTDGRWRPAVLAEAVIRAATQEAR